MSGRISVTTYFLEMSAPPDSPALPCPAHTNVVEAAKLEPETYQELYNAVGAPWLWYERTELPSQDLAKLISAPGVSIYLLQHKGGTAGYAELRATEDNQIQILYFGLIASFIGLGLGRYFLEWTVRRAFESSIDRLWVHTCSLDHPRALETYEAVGFVQYKQESGRVSIPQNALRRRDSVT